jgi:tetratricopeptide (TPR) repeat protein
MDNASPMPLEDAISLAALGENYRRQGRLTEALHILAGVVQAVPALPAPRTSLARVLTELGHPDLAVSQWRHLIELQPDCAAHRFNLGLAAIGLGRLAEAELSLRRAIALDPNLGEAYSNLAVIQIAQERFIEAEEHARQALRLSPDFAEAHSNLGCVLNNLNRLSEAEVSLRRAIALDETIADAHSNLGCVLNNLDRYEEGEASLRRAIELNPALAEAYGNLAWSLLNLARFEEAEACLRQTIALRPDLDAGHSNLGQFLLRQGNFEEGWIAFERRGKKPTLNIGQRADEISGTLWRGEPLAGRTLFVCVEQGFGDMIQFLRYIPGLRQAGGRIVLDLPEPLVPLARDLEEWVALIPFGSVPERFDFFCPLLSLPGIFGTRLDTIPAEIPYLSTPQYRAEIWRQRLAGLASPRVGIVWAGNPQHSNDRNRSIPLDQVARLFEQSDVNFVSLQKIVSAADAAVLAAVLASHPSVHKIGHLLDDYADTAAALLQLDLVIAVDTSVAHLAGALGRPTWVLLPFLPDWRWLLDRSGSPWYPSMRLFRQPQAKDWGTALAEVARALKAFRARFF